MHANFLAEVVTVHAVHVGVVVDHAKRVTVGDLADRVDGVEEDFLVEIDGNVPAALRDVLALDKVDEALQALVGADFKVDPVAAEVLGALSSGGGHEGQRATMEGLTAGPMTFFRSRRSSCPIRVTMWWPWLKMRRELYHSCFP